MLARLLTLSSSSAHSGFTRGERGERTLNTSMTNLTVRGGGGVRTCLAFATAFAAFCGIGLPVQADQAALAGPSPVVSINSTSGQITINGGEPGVRVHSGGGQNVSFSRFVFGEGNRHVQLPQAQNRFQLIGGRWRVLRLPARQFELPPVLVGRTGVSIGNPGGDMNVFVPNQVGALFVNAGASNVTLNGVRGPYVIQTSGGAVQLHNVVGRGLIRTLNGDIDVSGVGGYVRIETAAGNVVANPGLAERTDITTGSGTIDWTFARMGSGVYRFASTGGVVRVSLQPGVGAFVDALSDSGTVTNLFDPSMAQITFTTPHAVSLSIAGGGPQVTAYSRSGSVIIQPIGAR